MLPDVTGTSEIMTLHLFLTDGVINAYKFSPGSKRKKKVSKDLTPGLEASARCEGLERGPSASPADLE